MSEAKQAVVIGGGYIGIEAAQSFTKAGIKTTVIDTNDNIYAAGDATKVPYARRQAVIAAGKNKYKMPAVSGSFGLALFDYKFATTGIKDIDADTLEAKIESKYYEEQILPNFMYEETKITIKIHYENDIHRRVGAQLMSKKDVMMAINTVSVANSANWRLEDLALADFFYNQNMIILRVF